SGYVLSAAHLGVEKRKLALAVAARYFRLMLPILVTCLIAWLLLKWGLMFNLSLPQTPVEPYLWFQDFYHFEASLWNAIRFSTYDVFVKFNPKTSYNAILWTMRIELLGSFLIYGYLWLFRSTEKVHWLLALVATAILLVYKPLYACFLMGYLLAEINHKYAGGDLFGIARSTFTPRRSDVFFVTVFFLAALLSTLFRQNDQLEFLYATALVFAVSQARPLKQFFTNCVSRYLGRISFPLYLIHLPILCSWSSYLYIKLPTMGVAVVTANMLNIFSTITLSLLAATLLLPMEKFSIRYSKKIGALLISPWIKNTAGLGRVG
ncbi:MAG: acyltransferase family protein, partial [Rhodoferax sp.]|nr:acyltransferase family protein [Rhodoferax sp.]